jgi:hypothetical protein
MSNQMIQRTIPYNVLSSMTCIAMLFNVQAAVAQNPQLQEHIAEIKQASAAKQALARYTWQEQQTISIKGEVKKTQL